MDYTNNGCLNLVIKTYYENDSLSKDKSNKKYYIKTLEQDMLFIINNFSPQKKVSLRTSRSLPTIMESIEEHYYSIDVLNRVETLWNIMYDSQHQKMLVGYTK